MRFEVLLLLGLFAEEPVLLERILAVVNTRPVFLSNVTLLERVKGVSEKEALEETIDEQLMGEEASQLPQAKVTDEEEERLYQDLVKRLAGLPDDLSQAELRRLVHRQAVIVRYIDFRFRTEIRVSDADVEKAYEARYGQTGPPLNDVRVLLRKDLEDAQVSSKVEAWVKELRSSADIRYNAP
jgi:hypothetical protein